MNETTGMIRVSDKFTETIDVLTRLPHLAESHRALLGLSTVNAAREIGIGDATYRNFIKNPEKTWRQTLLKILAWMGGE